MKIVQRISVLANILLLSGCMFLLLQPGSSRSQPPDVLVPMKSEDNPVVLDNTTSDSNDPLEVFALQTPFVTRSERAYPVAPPAEVVSLLSHKKVNGQTDHFGFLLEYGLRVHQKYLEHTRLSRELPLKENMMLAELVRLTELPEYTNAHEAGWLNSQFYGKFSRTGHSSYQIYIWAKEHTQDWLDESRFPNWRRIGVILDAIDKSARNGVGGGMVCHYGCVP